MIRSGEGSFIFVGLGNPGQEYEKTRHNLGYLVIKTFADRMGWKFKEEKRLNAFVTKGVVENNTVHLLLPTTYMNLSGIAVRRYLDYLKLESVELVVVMDDIALPFEQLRLKTMGGTGGHKGLKSVEAHLGTSHYMRLRMGIGHPGEKVLADYVLEPFNREELEKLEIFVDRGIEVLKRLLKENPSQVMNTINMSPPDMKQRNVS